MIRVSLGEECEEWGIDEVINIVPNKLSPGIKKLFQKEADNPLTSFSSTIETIEAKQFSREKKKLEDILSHDNFQQLFPREIVDGFHLLKYYNTSLMEKPSRFFWLVVLKEKYQHLTIEYSTFWPLKEFLCDVFQKALDIDDREDVSVLIIHDYVEQRYLPSVMVDMPRGTSAVECLKIFQTSPYIRHLVKICESWHGPMCKSRLSTELTNTFPQNFVDVPTTSSSDWITGSGERNTYVDSITGIYQRRHPTDREKSESLQLIERQSEDVKVIAEELTNALEDMGGNFILTEDGGESDLRILPWIFTTPQRQSYQITFDLDYDELERRNELSLFIDEVQQRVASALGVKTDHIIVHRITRGRINLAISTPHEALGQMKHAFPQTQITPLAKTIGPLLKLNVRDFDSRGDNENFDGYEFTRGGLRYKQPSSRWKRVGLNVLGKYDNGNDDWLMMDGRDGEWAVGFHGCRTTEGTGSIAKGRNFKTTGSGQVYQEDVDVNELGNNYGKTCGQGAYFAQDIKVPAGQIGGIRYAAVDKVAGQKSLIVFQVRLNPKTVRIPESWQEILIAPDEESARPYGICVRKRSASCSIQ